MLLVSESLKYAYWPLQGLVAFLTKRKALVATYNDPEIRSGMSGQEEHVAKLLIMEFEQSGIHRDTKNESDLSR